MELAECRIEGECLCRGVALPQSELVTMRIATRANQPAPGTPIFLQHSPLSPVTRMMLASISATAKYGRMPRLLGSSSRQRRLDLHWCGSAGSADGTGPSSNCHANSAAQEARGRVVSAPPGIQRYTTSPDSTLGPLALEKLIE